MINEKVATGRRPRMPNGQRMRKLRRNMITIDFGDDVWGTRAIIHQVSRETGRTMSSIIREVLRKEFHYSGRKAG